MSDHLPDTPLSLWKAVVRLGVLTPAVSTIVLLPWTGSYVAVGAIVALAGAVLIGVPALWIADRAGVRSLFGLAALGSVSGLLPFALIAGWFLVRWGDVDRVFIAYVTFGALCGLLTAVVYWVLFLSNNWSSRNVLVVMLGIVGLAWLGAAWPQLWWPKTRVSASTMTARWAIGEAVDPAGTRQIRVWRDERPDCVASFYLPELVARFEAEPSAEVALVVDRIRRWGTAEQVQLKQVGGVVMPPAQVFTQSCLPWR